MLDIINNRKYFRGSPYDRGRERKLEEFKSKYVACPIQHDNCFTCPLDDCVAKEYRFKRGLYEASS